MNENTRDKSHDLIDTIYASLPAAIDGRALDAEFNDDNTITVMVGSDEYVISVSRNV